MADSIPLPVAIAGVGRRFESHYVPILRALQEAGVISIAGIYNRTASKALAAAPILGTTAFPTYQALASSGAVVVIDLIRGPEKSLFALRALKDGKHVFLETPAAHTVAMMRKLKHQADTCRKVLEVAEESACTLPARLHAQIVGSGVFGKAIAVFDDETDFAYHATAHFGSLLDDTARWQTFQGGRISVAAGLPMRLFFARPTDGPALFYRFPEEKNHSLRSLGEWKVICEHGILTSSAAYRAEPDGTVTAFPFREGRGTLGVKIGEREYSISLDRIAADVPEHQVLADMLLGFISAVQGNGTLRYGYARAMRDAALWRAMHTLHSLRIPWRVPASIAFALERIMPA